MRDRKRKIEIEGERKKDSGKERESERDREKEREREKEKKRGGERKREGERKRDNKEKKERDGGTLELRMIFVTEKELLHMSIVYFKY